jgi:hypothetical protein
VTRSATPLSDCKKSEVKERWKYGAKVRGQNGAGTMYLSDGNVEQWRRNRWEAKKALRRNQLEQRDRPHRNDLPDYRATKRWNVLLYRVKPSDYVDNRDTMNNRGR